MTQLAPFLAPPPDAGPAAGEEGPAALYAVLDAARDPRIFDALLERQARLELMCLYQGESAEDLADVAPYLLRLDPGCPDCAWLLAQGWGQAWFILVLSGAAPDVVRRHLRKFTMVWTEDGRSLLFRFYDPRVLRIFLPTCSAEQLARLFGPVILRFFAESPTADQALMFEWDAGGLRCLPVQLAGRGEAGA